MGDAPYLLFETVHGSRAYGLATASSDIDLKGFLVGPRAWYLGFAGGPEQIEPSPDHVRWELRKFFRLAAAANPTALEVLWTDAGDHRVVTPEGASVLAARDAFSSRRAAQTFGGYALSQLRRIRTHRQWLLTPPTAPPQRADFGLPERTVVPRDQLGAAEALMRDGGLDGDALSPNFLALMDRERGYRAARKQWQQHQQWLRERNPARAALEAAHGYDTKHAMHLVRLLRMGRELLETGRLVVRRPDRDVLLAIRGGAWSYDELIAEAEAAHEALAAAVATSPLPAAPDEAALDALCTDIIAQVLWPGPAAGRAPARRDRVKLDPVASASDEGERA